MKESLRSTGEIEDISQRLDVEVDKIVEAMNFKRKGNNYPSEMEIDKKVFSINGQVKKVEDEIRKSNGSLSPDLGIELAEMVYWSSQKNASERVKRKLEDYEDRLNIDHQVAQEIFLVKAKSEVEQSIGTNNRVVEEYLMGYFFNQARLPARR